MYNYLIKKEKWYNDNFLIFLNDKLIGQFSTSLLKNSETITFNDSKYIIKPKNIWGTEHYIKKGEETIGMIKSFATKNNSTISIFGKKEFFFQSNFFKSTQDIISEGKVIGTVKNKFSYTEIYTEEELDEEILSSLICLSHHENTVFLVIFVVIFVIIMT